MPTVDTTTIQGGYSQVIIDWIQGDDRDFTGNAAQSVNPPPANDPDIVSCYFTLKLNPLVSDADSILQVGVTTTLSQSGQITAGTDIALYVSGENYQSLVQSGSVYYWDFRTITTNGRTLTIANGIVQFVQNVTNTDAAGTPAAFPNNGLPRFRGFTNSNPQTNLSNTAYIFNIGDFYMNSQPTSNGPAGWQCIGQGNVGVWIQFFFSSGGGGGGGGFVPATNWTYGNGPPSSGAHGYGDIVWNLSPLASFPFGWICVAAGTPGTWDVMGLISR